MKNADAANLLFISICGCGVSFKSHLPHETKGISSKNWFLFLSAPSGARFLRVKVPNPPGSGKDIAESKGVHREVESEGSWM